MEAQRYPISVRVIGVMHKEKSKLYMTSVLWSDQNDIVIYRTLQDFKTMHRHLKKAFPVSSKKKSDRVIPTFQAKTTKSGKQRRGPNKSLVQLKSLQKYCNELLSCDPRVCQCADLIQFFHPKDQDLQPEFAKNSIIIMPSEDEMKAQAGPGYVGNVTQPFVTETYRCVAAYETKDTKNKPFKVATDEKVDVLIKDKAGWWLVEKEDKQMAWFPAPYLEKLDDDDDDEDDIDGTQERGMLYTAVKSYKATNDDEISVPIGATVELLQKSDNGWWLMSYNGESGYIPSMHLQPYNCPLLRLTAGHRGFRAPSPSLERQSRFLGGSQRSLPQQPPPARSPSLGLLLPDSRQKSRSLNTLSEKPPPAPKSVSHAANIVQPAVPSMHNPAPAIRVETDGDDEGDGFESDGSTFSFSDDDLSYSSDGQSLNREQPPLRGRPTHAPPPPPSMSNHLRPTYGLEGKMIPSVSDPNLYKGPASPKVPPRPRTQEILSRCSTVTRKNATKALRPTQTEILSL